MCQSLVATTWSHLCGIRSSTSEMPAATAAPPATGSEPPSQKSFWTSTMISARDTGPPLCGRNDGDGHGRVAGRQLQTLPRYRDQALPEVLPRIRERRLVDDLPGGDERPLQQAVVRLVVRHALGHHDLVGGRPGRLVPAYRGLAAAHGCLVLRALDHRLALDLDQLVDQPGGRRPGPGDH